MRRGPETLVENLVSGPWHGSGARPAFFRYFLPLSLLSLALVFGVLAIGTSNRSDQAMAELARDQQIAVDGAGAAASVRLSSVIGDVAVLAEQEALIGLSADPSDAELDSVAELFLSLARFRPTYQQLRFLDVTGMERVRIDLDADLRPSRVLDLQDKSGRYYFTNTIGLPNGIVYVSPLDLNVEFGEVEQPPRPMVRLGSTVVGSDGQLKGVVLVNQNANEYLDAISIGDPLDDTAHIVNDAGYWLKAPDAQLEWGFMFGRDDVRLSATRPDTWARFAGAPTGQFETDDGLITFREFNPLDDVETVGVSTAEAPGTFRWTIYSVVPPETLGSIRAESTAGLLVLGLALALVVLALSAITSYALGRRSLAAQVEREAAFVLEAAADGIAITDRNAQLIHVNPAFTALTGYAPDSILGQSAAVLTVELDFELVLAELRRSGRWSGRTRVRRADGSDTTQRLSISRMVDRRGRTARFIAVFNDVSAQVAAERQLEELATHDGLTGLANRPLIASTIDQALARQRRTGDPIAIMFIDLDGFKQVNDTMGHPIGDEVLVEVAARIERVVRDADVVGRFGGDEFVVVLPVLAEAADLNQVAARVLEVLAEPIDTSDGPATIGASIGISTTGGGSGRSANELIDAADAAMYDAKQQGGHRVAWIDLEADGTEDAEEPVRRRSDPPPSTS